MSALIASFIIFVLMLVGIIYFISRGLAVKPSPAIRYKPIYSKIKILDNLYEVLSLTHVLNDESLFIIHIPGNPGLIGFYENYFSYLYEKFEKKVNIIGTSNKGLLNISWKESFKNGFFFIKRCSLKDQVKYHLDFTKFLMKKHPNAKFIFTSHSLGSYILLEMLNSLPAEKVLKGFLLCPAIENLAKSPKGMKFIYKSSKNSDVFIYLSSFLLLIFFFIPKIVKKGILSHISNEENIVENIIRLHDFNVALNYINLGGESLRYVKDLNEKIIRKNEKKLYFFYTMYDEWIPLNLFNKMKTKFKKANFYLDDGRIAHAYILQGNEETVELVYKWIKPIK